MTCAEVLHVIDRTARPQHLSAAGCWCDPDLRVYPSGRVVWWHAGSGGGELIALRTRICCPGQCRHGPRQEQP